MKEKEVQENKNLVLYHCGIDEHYYHIYAESPFDAAVFAEKKWKEEDGGKPKDGQHIEVWEA